MEKQYDAPELTVIGQAAEVVLGSGTDQLDAWGLTAPDFEFEQD